MSVYSFKEIINYFESKLNATASKEDIDVKHIELLIDGIKIHITERPQEGGIFLNIELGTFFLSPTVAHVLKLAEANFLGISTAGCVLCLETSVLHLNTYSFPDRTLHQHWEALIRIVSAAEFWLPTLQTWEEFSPLIEFEQKQKESSKDSVIRV